MAKAYGIDEKHLPEIVQSTDIVGQLSADVAEQMGLSEGTPVIAGAGDVSMVAIGSGNTQNNLTGIYCGTSGSVCTVVQRELQFSDIMMISIKGPNPSQKYLYGELETAGRCFTWARHMIGKLDDTQYSYDECASLISKTVPGSRGLFFTPFLHGCKTPFEDGKIRGTLTGLDLETSRGELLTVLHRHRIRSSPRHQKPIRFLEPIQSLQKRTILDDLNKRNYIATDIVADPATERSAFLGKRNRRRSVAMRMTSRIKATTATVHHGHA